MKPQKLKLQKLKGNRILRTMSTGKVYKCDWGDGCTTRCKKPSELTKHIDCVHRNRVRYSCLKCRVQVINYRFSSFYASLIQGMGMVMDGLTSTSTSTFKSSDF